MPSPKQAALHSAVHEGDAVKCLLVAVILVMAGCASTPASPPARAIGSDIVPLNHLPSLKGDYLKLESNQVGRAYHVYVRLPEGYDPSSVKRYPVVYLLDGDSLFPMLAPQHLFLTYDEKLPEEFLQFRLDQ